MGDGGHEEENREGIAALSCQSTLSFYDILFTASFSQLLPVQMSAVKATVVGPVALNHNAVTHLYSQPRMEAYKGTMLWRETVMDWAVNVQTFAEGGDTKNKEKVACLALTLYRSLPLDAREQDKFSVRRWGGSP